MAAIAVNLALVSACSEQRPQDVKANAPENERIASPIDKQLDDLLGGGFYGSGSSNETATENSTAGLAEQSPTREIDSTIPPEQLIADLGFSGAQETAVEPIIKPAFCLDYDSSLAAVRKEQECDSISNRLASVSSKSCNAARLRETGCQSVEGFPILLTEFPPLENKTPQGRILVIGGTHGDELTSVSVVFRWIEKLNRYHSGLFHWHIAPMMNPDGVLNRAATRTNKNGVDLNRNMPSDDWEENAIEYWTNRGGKDPRKFPGDSSASEPETQWLIDEINDFQPDAIISVHAPYGVVDFDSLLLNTAPKSLGKLHLNLLGTYPGSLGNYAGINRNIPVITLELPHAWEMPSEAETTKIWEDIVSWLRKNIDNRTELAAAEPPAEAASE